jgi:hypothetical protein
MKTLILFLFLASCQKSECTYTWYNSGKDTVWLEVAGTGIPKFAPGYTYRLSDRDYYIPKTYKVNQKEYKTEPFNDIH